ncbi:MAG: S1C family serine protease [Clostridiales Family XIII bacterium]|jgi:S1-C subfamily serine protease|nr:S1C family serine protease [Clostridiales Family XIII bacterium]
MEYNRETDAGVRLDAANAEVESETASVGAEMRDTNARSDVAGSQVAAQSGFVAGGRVPGGIGRTSPIDPARNRGEAGGAHAYGVASSAQTFSGYGTNASAGGGGNRFGYGPSIPGGYGPYGSYGASATYEDTSSSAKKPEKSAILGMKRRTVAIVALFAILACALSGAGGGFIALQFAQNNAVTSSGDSYTINSTSDIGTTEAVAKKVLNSVVGITSTYTSTNPFGQSGESGGVGTGIIVHKDGYILTNSHVVMDGVAETIKVLLSDGREVDATLLWNDETIDLAVIKAEADGLAPAELGDSDKVRIGSYVAAIGNPLGLDFNGSITQGVVSGLNRTITASSQSKTTRMEGLIQVDAAINSGNSGGPLLNSKGQVIGVNTAKASAEGMGFAIPINTAKPIIAKIIETGSFERVYMGVSAANASDIAAQYPNLNLEVEKGAFVSEVAPGSPADAAGLKMKDVITSVDDKEISSSTDLIKALLNYSADDEVSVTFIRDGNEQTARVKLASQSQVYGEADPNRSQNDEGRGFNPFNELFPGWGD